LPATNDAKSSFTFFIFFFPTGSFPFTCATVATHNNNNKKLKMGPETCPVKTAPHQGAPSAVGPYSQAVKAGDLLFVSGNLGLDPHTMQFVEGGVVAEAEQALNNLQTVVEAAGSSLGKVIKTTVSKQAILE
jgi:enamine deaminase RidA (YjgF/YER057c/UK114 family)